MKLPRRRDSDAAAVNQALAKLRRQVAAQHETPPAVPALALVDTNHHQPVNRPIRQPVTQLPVHRRTRPPLSLIPHPLVRFDFRGVAV